MKLIHEYEDCIVGIIIGALIIGLSGYYFNLPNWSIGWGIIFALSAIFTIFDFFFTLFDLGKKIIPIFFLFLNNIIDIVIELSLAAYYLDFNIPYISEFINPYLSDELYLLIIGIFFIASSIFWIIATPIIWKEEPSKLKK